MFSTGDGGQRYLPDWVILGEDSPRRVFMDWLLRGTTPPTDEDCVVWVRYGTRLSVTGQDSRCVVETPTLLPQMTLCFPPRGAPAASLETAKRTKYAVLEEFPFGKQSSMDLLKMLRDSGREALMVLLALPRRQGSTDIIPPGEDLEKAVEAYRTKRFDVSVLRDAGQLGRVLHWHRPMYDTWVERTQAYLAEMDERVSDVEYDYLFLEEDWQEDGGPLQEQTMDRLFSYPASRRERGESLWDRYAAVSMRALFPSSGQGPLASVARLYKECLDNPLVFWPVDVDAGDFLASLQSAFVKALEKEEAAGQYRGKTKIREQLDENTYFSLAALNGDSGTALNAVFSRRIRDYLRDDVKRLLQERLRRRYEQLEEMIP